MTVNDLYQSCSVDVAVKACYDVRESSAFWNKLALHSQLVDEGVGNNADTPQWLSTHPNHESRAKKLDSIIPAVSVLDIYYDSFLTVFFNILCGMTVEEHLTYTNFSVNHRVNTQTGHHYDLVPRPMLHNIRIIMQYTDSVHQLQLLQYTGMSVDCACGDVYRCPSLECRASILRDIFRCPSLAVRVLSSIYSFSYTHLSLPLT